MAKISVIVPVYNVEKYLRQCLDSIVKQTFTDFECICVNDGSTDNSLSILEEYSKKDNRFKVVYQENKGLCSARNTGLKYITSQYITFIDSDDFVSSDYLENLLNVAIKENSDIVYCRHKMYYSLDNKYESGPNKEKLNKLFSQYEIAQNTEKTKYILDIVENSRSACMKLYKVETLKKNNLSFFENIYAEEDYAFNIVYNLFSTNISFLDEELYFYRKQIKSITTNNDNFRINSINSFVCLTKDLYKRKLLANNDVLQNFVINMFINNIGKKVPKNKIDIMFNIVVEHFNWLKSIYKNNLKLNFCFYITKIFRTKSLLFFRILKNLI